MKLDEIISLVIGDKRKIGAVIAIFLIFVYFDAAILMKAQINFNKGISPKIEKIKNDINSLSKNLAELRSLKDKKDSGAEKGKKLVESTEIPKLLEDIEKVCEKRNVTIMQIKPVKEAQKKDKKGNEDVKFETLLISLDLTGGYHEIGSLINDLENSDTYFVIQELKITKDDNYLKHNIGLVLKTYVKK